MLAVGESNLNQKMAMNFQINVLRGYLSRLLLILLIASSVPVAAEPPKRYQLHVPWPIILPPNLTGRTLLVSMPKAAPGFDTSALVYYDNDYKIRYDIENQWVETPARMLWPLLVLSLEATGKFKAVLSAATSPIACELRLDTEIVRLQQESLPDRSEVYLVFRAQLLDMAMSQVVATKVFEIRQNAGDKGKGNAKTGVWATNQAFALVLKKLKNFVEEQLKYLTENPLVPTKQCFKNQ
jgi:cholesterol transport system auxiliary component